MFFSDELMLTALGQDAEQSSEFGTRMSSTGVVVKSQTTRIPTTSRVHKVSSKKRRVKKKGICCPTL